MSTMQETNGLYFFFDALHAFRFESVRLVQGTVHVTGFDFGNPEMPDHDYQDVKLQGELVLAIMGNFSNDALLEIQRELLSSRQEALMHHPFWRTGADADEFKVATSTMIAPYNGGHTFTVEVRAVCSLRDIRHFMEGTKAADLIYSYGPRHAYDVLTYAHRLDEAAKEWYHNGY